MRTRAKHILHLLNKALDLAFLAAIFAAIYWNLHA